MRLRQKLLFSIIAVMGINFLLVLMCLLSVQGRSYLDARGRETETVRRMLQAALDALPDDAGAEAEREALVRQATLLAAAGSLGDHWRLLDAGGRVLAGAKESVDGADAAAATNAPAPNATFGLTGRGRSRYEVRFSARAPRSAAALLDGLDMLLGVMLAGTAALTAVVYVLLSRLVLDPVDDLVRATRRLAQGESAFVRPPPPRRDEMGALLRAFSEMADEVRRTRANLEERVRAATEEVEATQRRLAFQERLAATGRLAAGIAHEINNPLGGCINAAARIRRDDLPPERKAEYIDLVLEGLERIRSIVARVLEFARREPTVQEIDPVAPLRKALAFCTHRAEKDGIPIRDEAPDVLPRVRVDPGELQQVFLNLLQNALDAMPEGGDLVLRGAADEAVVCLEVVDTGIGMTPEEVSAGFDLFHTTKPVGQGTGLGLSIAYNTVTRYGGTLTLDSRKGEGTVARVRLPRAKEDSA